MIDFLIITPIAVLGWYLIFAKKIPFQLRILFYKFKKIHEKNSAALKVYVIGFFITLLVFITTKVFILVAISVVTTIALPGIIIKNYQKRVIQEKSDAWPFLIDDLISAIRAGMTLPDSLLDVAKNAPSALAIEMAAFSTHYNKSGQINHSLKHLSKNIVDPIGGLVMRMLLTVIKSGANDLAKSLKILGEAVREEQQLNRELVARQSWVMNSARLAVISPWIVLIAIWSQPTVQTAYQSQQGQLILLIIAGICFAAYSVMKRMAIKQYG